MKLLQFNSNHVRSNIEFVRNKLIEVFFYIQLVHAQVFFEFIKHIKIDRHNSRPNLGKVIKGTNNLRGIRNSIAHFDWKFKSPNIILKINGEESCFDAYELSMLCSLLNILGIFMFQDFSD